MGWGWLGGDLNLTPCQNLKTTQDRACPKQSSAKKAIASGSWHHPKWDGGPPFSMASGGLEAQFESLLVFLLSLFAYLTDQHTFTFELILRREV